MKMRSLFFALMALLLPALLWSSCQSDDAGVDDGDENLEAERPKICPKIAVVVPLSSTVDKQMWEIVAQLLTENMAAGQPSTLNDTLVVPEFVWYDEDTEDLEALATKLSQDDDVKVIVGPFENKNVYTFTRRCYSRRKPVITPHCSSAEICHVNASHSCFWSLTEPDITQLKLMMTEGALYLGKKKMGLICSYDPDKMGNTGNTYVNWIGYESTELNIRLGALYAYDDDASEEVIKETFKEAVQNTELGVLLCAPSTTKEAVYMLDAYAEYGTSDSPRLFFSDKAYSSDFDDFNHKDLPADIFVFAPVADPARGFEMYFRLLHAVTYNSASEVFYSSLLYDALEIASLACVEVNLESVTKPYASVVTNPYAAAVMDIVSSADPDGTERTAISGWNTKDIAKILEGLLSTGKRYDLQGSSGSICFDPEVQSSSTRTIYAFYKFASQFHESSDFESLDYLTKDGTARTGSTTVIWEETSKAFEDKDLDGSNVTYTDQATSQWALLVSASMGWQNYRHTQDVLEMYRLLIKNGYDPDHIVVVAQRDLCQDSSNPHPGEIRNWKGEVIYRQSDPVDKIDYQVGDLTNGVADIFRILRGDDDGGRLKKVIHPDELANVLVYWSGHGSRDGYFVWGDTNGGMTSDNLQSFMKEYEADHKYRKMLWVTEPCYGGAVGVAMDMGAIQHALFMTSSNSQEESKGDVNDNDYDTWMCDLFSKNVVSMIESNPGISLGTLYEQLVSKTWGSHPRLYGDLYFGKLHSSYAKEFFIYQ